MPLYSNPIETQIRADYLWGATLVEIRYLICEKELINTLLWLQAEVATLVAARANTDNMKLAQVHYFIESYTTDLYQVWDNIVKLHGTYIDNNNED
jgi:hypothetical protein